MQRVTRRLTDAGTDVDNPKKIEKRWETLLHGSIYGKGLIESNKIPQQHRRVTKGNRFLCSRDFINAMKLRINALSTRSRTSRGRTANRHCRAGCNATETLNHVLQQCHRTHKGRIERHDAIVKYIKRALENKCQKVEVEPQSITSEGKLKPDLAKKNDMAWLIDAQIVSERIDLDTAHQTKIDKYKGLCDAIKDRYVVKDVSFLSVTLSYRGVWSAKSANELMKKNIRKKELKFISTRVIVGGF